jgi:hypothetical protein
MFTVRAFALEIGHPYVLRKMMLVDGYSYEPSQTKLLAAEFL